MTNNTTIRNAYALRNSFELGNYNTTITRETFERHFHKTKESIRFSFNGWDGKSYDGESRTARVLRTDRCGAVTLTAAGDDGWRIDTYLEATDAVE